MSSSFGDFTLDPGGRQLRGPEGEIRLSPKALEFLMVLAAHWPAAVSKNELHRVVWPTTAVSDDSLARLATEVRAALGDDAREPRFIRTVHGFGYAMALPVTPVNEEDAKAEPIPPTSHVRSRPAVRYTLAACGLTLVVGLVVGHFTSRPWPVAEHGFIQFRVIPPDDVTPSASASALAMSPDGTRLAFLAAAADGRRRIWMRRIDSLATYELRGTEDALGPFWSRDSERVAFFTGPLLRAVDADGGPVETICELGSGVPPGGSWRADGTILVGGGPRGILRIDAADGCEEPVPVTGVDAASERGHILPVFLPDGRHFLYVSQQRGLGASVYVAALDGSRGRRLLTADSQVEYVPTGHLLYLRGDVLMAQPFHASALALAGPAQPVVTGVGRNRQTPRGMFSASETGRLVFRGTPETEYVWLDRQGTIIGRPNVRAEDTDPALAPTGTSLAVTRPGPDPHAQSVWAIDQESGAGRPVALASAWSAAPVWSSDSRRLAFAARDGGLLRIVEKAVDEPSAERTLLNEGWGIPTDWSRDGRFLLFDRRDDGRSLPSEVWAVDLDGHAGPTRLSPAGIEARQGRFSPDGRWVAYASRRSGRFEVSVVAFPGGARGVQASTTGGVEPRWRADGRELFYLAPDGSLMTVPVSPGEGIRLGVPRALFRTGIDASGSIGVLGRNQYTVSTDGRRFLVRQPVVGGESRSLVVAVNWPAMLASARDRTRDLR